MSSTQRMIDRGITILVPVIFMLNSIKFGPSISPLYHLVAASVLTSTIIINLQRLSYAVDASNRVLVVWTFGVISVGVPLGCLVYVNLSGRPVIIEKTVRDSLLNLTPFFILWVQCLSSIAIHEALRTGFRRNSTHGERLLLVQLVSIFTVVFASTRFSPPEFSKMSLNNRVLVEIGGMCMTSAPLLFTAKKLLGSTISTSPVYYFILMVNLAYTHQAIAKLVNDQPISWLVKMICETNERLFLFRSWLIIITATTMFAVAWSYFQSGSNCIMRKVFHLALILIFFSGYEHDLKFLSFSGGCTLALFIMLEIVRVMNLPPLGPLIERAFSPLRGDADNASLTLGHIYLLAGFFLPIWLMPYLAQGNRHKIIHLSGLISVGIGDSLAAILGSLFGSHRWPGSNRTVEGTIAAYVAQVLFAFSVLNMDQSTEIRFMVACAIVSLAEAFSGSYDNISLPLIMTCLWLL